MVKRYFLPLVPFLFTIPATVVAVRVMSSWHTDTHYTCAPYHPFWNSSVYLWAPALGALGLASSILFCWTPEAARPLRWAAPGLALVVLAWSAWFFPHWFRLDWCI
jgi:uncharacterized BrkB/YihY/UPF0761 family membrane protein